MARFTLRNFQFHTIAESTLVDQVQELLRLRGIIGQAIEHARQEKLIGNTLEARVVLNSDSDVTEDIPKEELEEFFIVSDLTIHQAKEASASVTKTPYKKCARCWRHRSTVGTSKEHPDLCDRCESVVANDSTLQRFNASKPMKFILFLSLPLYGLDQLTKRLVLQFINPLRRSYCQFRIFSLWLTSPTPVRRLASFKGNNTFFVVISLHRIGGCDGSACATPHPADLWRDISLALLLAGILGNLTDRLLYGHVIDFLLFNLHVRYADPWPAFNVADSCISIAVVLFIIHSFRGRRLLREDSLPGLSRPPGSLPGGFGKLSGSGKLPDFHTSAATVRV